MNDFLRFASAFLLAATANAATLTVNSTADDGTGTCTASKCTLRDAVVSAAPFDKIAFSLPANSAILLTNGELSISKRLSIAGPDANLLTVQRSSAPGTSAFRIFNIASTIFVSISGLTIANGSAPNLNGGGVANSGMLELKAVTVSGNSSDGGAGIHNAAAGKLSVSASTVSGNSASGAGGGLLNEGSAQLFNTTISGNSGNIGGGLYNNNGTATVYDTTISANVARGTGGGLMSPAAVGLALRNTIVAGNTAQLAPDAYGTVSSEGYNLIGNNSNTTATATTGDQIGTAAAPINPLLGPLQDNGGPTKTHALLVGSTAIDRGDLSVETTDQRGFDRRIDSPLIANAGDSSDIGAFEVQPDQLAGCSEINLEVGNGSDSGAGSLRSVVANACGGSTVTFAPTVRGAINLTSGEVLISRSVRISGPGANVLTVQRSAAPGTPNFRVVNVASADIIVTISGLTIANGISGAGGGGISNAALMILRSVTVSANSARNGGGLYNSGTLQLIDSTVSGNTVSSSTVAGSGGGIFNFGGNLDVRSSTISGNSAIGPGGISDSGGGIITNVGFVSLTDSTVADNSADIGGGIRNVNGGTISALNTILALNISPLGPDVNGPLLSFGYNLIGSGSLATVNPVLTSDQIGVTAAQVNLGPLQYNGGATQTQALLPGSVAIDRGSPASNTPATDQRGLPRPSDLPGIPNVAGGDGRDIGAFELQALPMVVEFYNVSLDHYFITWLADEISKLDAGTLIKGWTRTGTTFATYASAQAGTSPVCRYYIPPGLGDSHFFGRGTVECNATGQKNPSFVLEDPAFMHMFLPQGGNCPSNTTQIYRVFSNRLDANHRYMTDKAIRASMVAKGWLAEGDGPDLVVMCAPQ